MNEDQNTVTDAVPEVSDVRDVFAATVPAEAPKKSSRGRKLLTVVLPAVLVLGAVGGGITYTGVTVSAANRAAPTTVWEQPDAKTAGKDPASGAARGNASTQLSKLLLPVPEGFVLGPDIESYGNDSELSEQQAVALVKEDGRGLAGNKRRDYDKRVDRLGIQGIAMRSFASVDNDLVVEVRISRMKNKSRLKDAHALRVDLMELLEFPKGPTIKGHKTSACFLTPDWAKDDEDDEAEYELELMACSAYDSELLVSVDASGGKPFDKAAVAELVKKQLDHISSPGEYV